jgi:hypothetical protein
MDRDFFFLYRNHSELVNESTPREPTFMEKGFDKGYELYDEARRWERVADRGGPKFARIALNYSVHSGGAAMRQVTRFGNVNC